MKCLTIFLFNTLLVIASIDKKNDIREDYNSSIEDINSSFQKSVLQSCETVVRFLKTITIRLYANQLLEIKIKYQYCLTYQFINIDHV